MRRIVIPVVVPVLGAVRSCSPRPRGSGDDADATTDVRHRRRRRQRTGAVAPAGRGATAPVADDGQSAGTGDRGRSEPRRASR